MSRLLNSPFCPLRVEMMRTLNTAGGVHILAHPGNLIVPSKRRVCSINNLPPELLSRIFEIGFVNDLGPKRDGERIYDVDGKVDFGSHSSIDFSSLWPPSPVLVSRVCGYWRSVALSTPSLWTRIGVSQEARPPYKRVSKLLERSKDHAIDVYIICIQRDHSIPNGYVETPSDADLAFLFDMLVPHIHRWRTMAITTLSYRLMHAILTAIGDPLVPAAPQLTTLSLTCLEHTEEFDNFWYPNLSQRFRLFDGIAPSLTRLFLWGVHVDWNQPWIASASNLKELELAFHAEDVRPSWAQFTSILRGAPGLEKLSLRRSGPSGDPARWFIQPAAGCSSGLNVPIQLLRVTHFVLANHSPARAVGLIHKLYLPVLKNLVLSLPYGNYTDFIHELARPVASLSPSRERPRSLLSRLEGLRIAELHCSEECLQVLCSELGDLTSLNIALLFLPRDFADILCTPCTLSGRGDVWLPKLETLYVSYYSQDALRKLVQKRRQAGVPLSSLYTESFDEETLRMGWLQRNMETTDFLQPTDDELSADSGDSDDLREDSDMWLDEDE